MFRTEMDQDQAPEIQRTSLTSVALTLKSLGVDDFSTFDFVDPPSPDALAAALTTLLLLGAVTSTGELAQTGRLMAELPLDPHHAKMLLHAQGQLGCGRQAAAAVAVMSLQNSLFTIPRDKRADADAALARFFRGTTGDVVGFVNVFQAWEAEGSTRGWSAGHFLNHQAATRAREIRNQLVNALERLDKNALTSEGDPARLDESLTRSFLAGFFMNAAVLSADMVTFAVARSRVTDAMIHPSSCFFQVMSRRQQQQAQRQDAREARRLGDAAGVGVGGGDDDGGGATRYRFCDPDTQKPPLIVFEQLRATPRHLLANVVSVPEAWVREAAPTSFFGKSDLRSSITALMEAAAARRRQREQ
jgi:HrpA-like RNA helicase